MNIQDLDAISLVPSTLKVVASKSLDVSQDLDSNNEKSIAELMNAKKEEEEEENTETDKKDIC